MKQSIIIIIFCLLGATYIQAQGLKWGPRIGMSTSQIKPKDLIITNQTGLEEFQLEVLDAEFGYNAGLFLRLESAKKIFLQTELHVSMATTRFQLTELADVSTVQELSETYYNLNLPIHLGMKFGPIRFQGGVIGTRNIGGKSDLVGIVTNYEQAFDDLNIGWQAGIGADIWKLTLDIRYEGDFGKFADHMQFFGEGIAFDDRERLLKFSLGWKF